MTALEIYEPAKQANNRRAEPMASVREWQVKTKFRTNADGCRASSLAIGRHGNTLHSFGRYQNPRSTGLARFNSNFTFVQRCFNESAAAEAGLQPVQSEDRGAAGRPGSR